MKTHILFMVVILSYITTYTIEAQSFCSTPAKGYSNDLYSSILRKTKVEDSYCIRIYVHVIRKSDSTAGQTIAHTKEAINIMKKDYSPHKIYFEWENETIDYINNDKYFDTPTNNIFSVNNHNDGIDIYLFDDSSAANGRANGVGESSEFWVSGSYWKPPFGSLSRSSVISHEMGHVLFLWHTHHGTRNEGGNPDQCAELVNGSNGSTCGDYVSDTPADPFLEFNVNHPDCEWKSSGTDSNNDPYDPDELIIMYYTHPDCMSYFTSGQGQRIRNAIATLPHLNNAIVNCENCQENLTITQNVTSGQTDIQEASNTIIAKNTIFNNATASYTAGDDVTLTPNFEVKKGASVDVSIQDCSNSQRNLSNSLQKNDDKPTSITKNLIVYPNPSKGNITIEYPFSNNDSYQIELYSYLGNKILQKKVSKSNNIVDLENLQNGIYFIKLFDKQSVVTKEILISK